MDTIQERAERIAAEIVVEWAAIYEEGLERPVSDTTRKVVIENALKTELQAAVDAERERARPMYALVEDLASANMGNTFSYDVYNNRIEQARRAKMFYDLKIHKEGEADKYILEHMPFTRAAAAIREGE